MNNKIQNVYLVTDDSLMDFSTLYEKIEESLEGGAKILQFREKKSSSKTFYEHAIKIKALCQKYNVPLIINDRLDIALAVDADGVHLGQSDLPFHVARKILGKDKIIGISTRTLQESLDAQHLGADYIGVGAMFPTTTKSDACLVSKEELMKIRSSISIPIVAIGGITLDNASSLIHLGVDSIAVISAILNQKNPKQATLDLNALF